MSRLDSHISAVRNKLALTVFLESLAMAGMGLAVVLLIAIVGQKVLDRELSHGMILLGVGLAGAVVGAWIFSLIRRPTSEQAAVKIDETLGLKEKFSTALYCANCPTRLHRRRFSTPNGRQRR